MSTQKGVTTMSLLERVYARIVGGEKANVLNNYEAVKKAWKKCISDAEKAMKRDKDIYDDAVDVLKEKVIEAEELFNEAFEAIPAERILSDGKEAFIARYEANISAEAEKVKKAKAAVETLTAKYEAQVKENEKIIATYTEFLAKLA